MKTILVTGATGFIGANLVRRLVQDNCNVHITSRENTNKWRIKNLRDITQHICDLRDRAEVQRLVCIIKPDTVYHLAAYGSYPSLQQNLNTMIQTNIIGTLNLIEAAAKVECDILINSGSSSEYGLKTQPMRENMLLEPIHNYGVSKAAVSLFCQVSNQSVVTLRPFSVYGYYEEPTRLIPYLIISCLHQKELSLTEGKQTRDFIFIEDVIDAYIKAASIREARGEIINIGSGIQYTVREVAERVIEQCGKGLKVNWGALPYKGGETSFWVADNSKAKRILDWMPQNTLEQGLKKTIEWFKENTFEEYRMHNLH